MNTNILPHTVEAMAIAYNHAADEFDSIPDEQLRVFRKLINQQYSDISKHLNIEFVDYEPYGENPKIADVLKDFHAGTLKIHTTGNDSKVWGKFTNLQFRAIHDYIHCLFELEFNHAEEVKAYKHQLEFSVQGKYAEMFAYLNWDTYSRILRSEIVYQSAYKEHYGKFHIHQKIVLNQL